MSFFPPAVAFIYKEKRFDWVCLQSKNWAHHYLGCWIRCGCPRRFHLIVRFRISVENFKSVFFSDAEQRGLVLSDPAPPHRFLRRTMCSTTSQQDARRLLPHTGAHSRAASHTFRPTSPETGSDRCCNASGQNVPLEESLPSETNALRVNAASVVLEMMREMFPW